MSSSGSPINYKDTFFEYPDVIKIHGQPTPETLIQLKKELKANAASVPSNLSDGLNGHLGTVLNPPSYALVSNVPFVAPVHPGTLVIPPGTTGPMATVMKEAHRERLRVFREVQGVDRALKQQITKAVSPKYLTAIRNRVSNSLQGNVYQILDHLFNTYGKVTVAMLENKEATLRTTSYNPSDPVDDVFDLVDDFVEYADMARQPQSQAQTVAKAYSILRKTGRFEISLLQWNKKPSIDQNWINFKTHFRQAQQDLNNIQGPTIQASDFNANLVQSVVEGVQQALLPEDDQMPEILEQVVNSVAKTSSTNEQLLNHVDKLQEMVTNLQAQINQTQPFQPIYQSPYQPFGRGFGGGRGRGRGRGGYYSNPRRHDRYCWTHGACAHDSATCNHKKSGHKNDATFTNKMGGSTVNCNPAA